MITYTDDDLKLMTRLYQSFTAEKELTVSSPGYNKMQIDQLIENELICKIADASTLSGWMYIIGPTYKGANYRKQYFLSRKESRIKALIFIIKYIIPPVIAILALIVSFLVYEKN